MPLAGSVSLLLLLAATASAPVQLHLPDQSFVPKAVYPHPACVCLPQGWAKDSFTLTENSATIDSQAHVRSRWPDGSAKWLHVYAAFQFKDGQAARYELAPADAESPAAVRRATSARDIKDFTPVLYFSDDLRRDYTAGNVKVEKLDDGSVATVYHLTGEMVSKDPLLQPFLTFDTWVTLYANRADVEHAFIVASDLRAVRIAELGLKLRAPAGWIGVLRDEPKRAPQKLVQDGQSVDVVLWPKGGSRRVAANMQNLHTFPWLHSGQYLDFRAPDDAYEFARKLQAEAEAPYKNTDGTIKQGFWGNAEWSETRAENLRTSTPEGISIACQFSLVKVDAALGSRAYQAEADGWRTLIQQKPVARPSSQWIADSEALGTMAPRSKKYEAFEKQLDSAHLAFHNPTKTGAFGWANFGNAPERMVQSSAAAPVGLARPASRVFQYRSCSYNHYWVHPMWINVFRGGPKSVLDAARRTTDYLAAFGQCRHSELRADGRPVKRGKVLWGFYHSGNFYPWGTTDYGLSWPDVECALTGHWIDPYALQLAWLHDCNWFAKTGYDGWLKNVDPREDANGREANTILAQCVYAYRYTGEQRFLQAAQRLASSLEASPLLTQGGALWCPVWPILAEEVLDSEASRQYILDSAKDVAARGDTAWQVEGLSTLALIARAVELGGDPKMLEKVMPPRGPVKQNAIELGPGPLGEAHQTLAWPMALKALQRMEAKN